MLVAHILLTRAPSLLLQWVGNRYSGLGVETFTTGSTYHGGYRDGQRHGWGACSFANGDY